MKAYPERNSGASSVLKPLTTEQKAKRLLSFVVTADSVVATATLVTDKSHTLIKIWWGDEGENEPPQTIDLRKERLVLTDPSPEDTIRLQHVYAVDSLRKIVLVQTRDVLGKSSWESAVITLEPRYRFRSYPIHLEIEGHLDTIFESESEFHLLLKVSQDDQVILDEEWRENIVTLINIGPYPVFFTLKGSDFSLEMSYHDEPIDIALRIIEEDNVLKDVVKWIVDALQVEFDTSVPIDGQESPFHPRIYTGYKEFRFPHIVDDVPIIAIYRTSMDLIIPLDLTDATALAPTN